MMNTRSAILSVIPACAWLCLACGASPKAKNTPAAAAAPGSEHRATSAESAPPPLREETPIAPPLSFEEAQKRADEMWKKAEASGSDAAQWELAARALGQAAEAAGSDAEAAKRLLRGALAAWDKSEPAKPREAVPSGPRAKEVLPDRVRLGLQLLASLAALVPSADKEQALIAFRQGRILWRFGHYIECRPHFEGVLERFPSLPEAKVAASLLLDSLVLTGDFEGLEAQAARLLKERVLLKAHPDLAVMLERIRHQAGNKEAERLAKAEDFKACGEAYLSLFTRDKKLGEVRGDHLLFNASVCFEKSAQQKRAIKVLRQLVRLFPSSSLAAQAKERADALSAR